MKRRVGSAPEAGQPGLVLDAGALLAIESGKLTDVLGQADILGLPIRLSAGALAQAWRGGPRGARLAALLKKKIIVIALDLDEARRVGEFVTHTRLKRTSRFDVVDAHVALIARETRSLVYTSDYDEIAAYGIPDTLIRRV